MEEIAPFGSSALALSRPSRSNRIGTTLSPDSDPTQSVNSSKTSPGRKGPLLSHQDRLW